MLLIPKLASRVCRTTSITNKEKYVSFWTSVAKNLKIELFLLPLVEGVIGPQSACYGALTNVEMIGEKWKLVKLTELLVLSVRIYPNNVI